MKLYCICIYGKQEDRDVINKLIGNDKVVEERDFKEDETTVKRYATPKDANDAMLHAMFDCRKDDKFIKSYLNTEITYKSALAQIRVLDVEDEPKSE